MTPDRLRRVRDLFDLAHDVPKAERTHFVRREAAGDESLARDVISLLEESETEAGEPSISPIPLPLADVYTAEVVVAAFEAGDVLAGRYEIMRMIGRGGMGEVYEVQDLDLNTRVALKTLHVSKVVGFRFVERLKRETELARRIAHPNVCRIFDFGFHRSSEGPEEDEGAHFMTMELLHGESLAERLRRRGPLPADETMSLTQQMLDGLGAAHAAGVVHRDFKPSNVILVPVEGDYDRAVITDFGVARGIAPADAQRTTLTATGTLLGTPAYMAPEQVLSEEATPASDLYSMGLVVYEMIAGELPFAGSSPMSVALKRVEVSKPPRLRDKIPDVDRRLEKIVARCLQRNPEDRFATAEAMSRALRGGRVGLPPRARRTLRRWAAVSLLLALTLATGGYLLKWHSLLGRSDLRGHRPSLTVFPFSNASKAEQTAWIPTAARDMLMTLLSASGAFRVVPVESVGVVLDSTEGDRFPAAELSRLRSLNAAFSIDYAIIGRCELVRVSGVDTIRMEIRCQELSNGRILTTLKESGRVDEIYDLADRCTKQLRETLGAGGGSPEGDAQLRNIFSLAPDAAQLYAEGLEALHVFDGERARAALSGAAERSPKSPQIHAALADAWEALGYQSESCDESARAFDLSTKLPREIRMDIEARHSACANDWHRAVEIRRALFTFFPDEIERGLDLASVQVAGGDGEAALATLAAIRLSVPDAARDPRLKLAEANACESIGNYRKEQAAAEESAAQASRLGALLLEARALQHEGWALYQQGEYDRALKTLGDARERFEKGGNRGAAMTVLTRMSGSLGAMGRYEEIRTNCLETIAFYDRAGNKRGASRARMNLANALDGLHRRREAIRVNEEAISLAREVGDLETEGWATANAGQSALLEGELAEAHGFMERAVAIARQMKNDSIEADALLNISAVEIEMGKLESARNSARRASEIYDRLGGTPGYLLAQGNLAECERQSGNLLEAERIARSALKRTAGTTYYQEASLLGVILTQILLAEGETVSAREALDSAVQSTRKVGIDGDVWTSVAKARVDAAEGKTKVALAEARQVLTELGPQSSEGIGVILEVRLCVGELEIKHGLVKAGRRHLAEVARDAHQKGFKIIERNALRAAAD